MIYTRLLNSILFLGYCLLFLLSTLPSLSDPLPEPMASEVQKLQDLLPQNILTRLQNERASIFKKPQISTAYLVAVHMEAYKRSSGTPLTQDRLIALLDCPDDPVLLYHIIGWMEKDRLWAQSAESARTALFSKLLHVADEGKGQLFLSSIHIMTRLLTDKAGVKTTKHEHARHLLDIIRPALLQKSDAKLAGVENMRYFLLEELKSLRQAALLTTSEFSPVLETLLRDKTTDTRLRVRSARYLVKYTDTKSHAYGILGELYRQSSDQAFRKRIQKLLAGQTQE